MNTLKTSNYNNYFEKIFTSRSVKDSIFIVDDKGFFVRTSTGFANLLGYSNGDLVGKHFSDIIHRNRIVPESFPDFSWHYFLRCSDETIQMNFIGKNNNEIPVMLRSVVIEDAYGTIKEAMGIVESLSESALREMNSTWEADHTLQSILEYSGDGIIACNANGYITLVNNAFMKIIGKSKEWLMGRHLLELTPDEGTYTDTIGSEVLINDEYIRVQAQKATELFERNHATYRLYILRDDGILVPVEGSFSVLFDGGNNRKGTMGIVRDITSQYRGEHRLSESKEFLEKIFKTSTDGILVTNAAGVLVSINDSVEKIIGMSVKDILGRHVSELIAPAARNRNNAVVVHEIFEDLKIRGYVEGFQTVFQNADGQNRNIDLNIGILRDSEGEMSGAVISARDITDRKLMEAELLRAKRLESVSNLASGIANDFDAILTRVLGNISNAQSAEGLSEQTYNHLLKAEKGVIRSKDIINQLITFSRDGHVEREPGSITELLTSLPKEVLQGTDIHCEFSIGTDLWPVEFDRIQIEQVLRSLLINAEQAMPDGGTIRIAAENMELEEQKEIPLKPGQYIRISLQDQGVGILNEYIQDIFNPYLKQGRKRSGLVLATAYSIINKHHGLITVESEFGAGTTFIIYLPAIS